MKQKAFLEAWALFPDMKLAQVHGNEMEALWKHCHEFKNGLFVEIGSAHGKSSSILAEAARNTDSKVICVDNFRESYYDQALFGDIARKAFNKHIIKNYSDVVTLCDMDSEAAAMAAGPIEIDVLFIDGGHELLEVEMDCKMWLPKLKSGGYVGFHDYNNVTFHGVKESADKFTSGWAETDNEWDLRVFKKP